MKKHLLTVLLLIALMLFSNMGASVFAEEEDTPADDPEIERILEHDHDEYHYINPTASTHEVWSEEVYWNTVSHFFVHSGVLKYVRTESHEFIEVNQSVPIEEDEIQGIVTPRICVRCDYIENVG